MAKTEELLKLEQALAAKQFAKTAVQSKDDDEGDAGGEGSSGQSGITVEKRLFIETFSLLRNGEKQFGPTNEFDPLAYLAKDDKSLKGELSHEAGNRLKSHPILSKLSKFDGDTSKMTMDPTKNSEAQNRYENRLQLQMSLRNRAQPKPTPGGR